MASKSKIAKAAEKPKFSTRLNRRCKICGRPRAVYRKFGICRICFRKLADDGLDSGREKSELVDRLAGSSGTRRRAATRGRERRGEWIVLNVDTKQT